MTKRSLLAALMLTGLLSACSPEALLGTIAGPQVEAAFYEHMRTEMSGQGMAKAQVDCIVSGLQQKITAQDIVASGTAAGMEKVKPIIAEVTTACVTGQQASDQTK